MSDQQIAPYTLDIAGLHAHMGDLDARLAILTQVMQRLLAALDMPAMKNNVEAGTNMLGSIMRATENLAKRMEKLTAYTEPEDAEISPSEMAEMAKMLGGGKG